MSKTPINQTRLMLAIAGAILAISTAAIFIKFAQRDAPALVIAAARLTIATLMLTPFTWARHGDEIRSLTRRELILALLAGLFLALHFAAWISSLQYTSVSSSTVIVTTAPLWVALISPFALKESLQRNAIFGLILALSGGILVALSDSCRWQNALICPSLADFFKGQALWGNFLSLFGAWMAAGYLLIGRRLRARLSLMPYVFVVYGMGALVLIVLMLAAGQSPLGLAPLTYLWLLALALIPQLIGHSTFNWALRYLPASFVSVTLLGEPVGATILAYFLLGETPTPFKLVGAGLILAGIYAVGRVEG